MGCALLGEDGKIYTGCNVENVAYGSATCAERVRSKEICLTGTIIVSTLDSSLQSSERRMSQVYDRRAYIVCLFVCLPENGCLNIFSKEFWTTTSIPVEIA